MPTYAIQTSVFIRVVDLKMMTFLPGGNYNPFCAIVCPCTAAQKRTDAVATTIVDPPVYQKKSNGPTGRHKTVVSRVSKNPIWLVHFDGLVRFIVSKRRLRGMYQSHILQPVFPESRHSLPTDNTYGTFMILVFCLRLPINSQCK